MKTLISALAIFSMTLAWNAAAHPAEAAVIHLATTADTKDGFTCYYFEEWPTVSIAHRLCETGKWTLDSNIGAKGSDIFSLTPNMFPFDPACKHNIFVVDLKSGENNFFCSSESHRGLYSCLICKPIALSAW